VEFVNESVREIIDKAPTPSRSRFGKTLSKHAIFFRAAARLIS